VCLFSAKVCITACSLVRHISSVSRNTEELQSAYCSLNAVAGSTAYQGKGISRTLTGLEALLAPARLLRLLVALLLLALRLLLVVALYCTLRSRMTCRVVHVIDSIQTGVCVSTWARPGFGAKSSYMKDTSGLLSVCKVVLQQLLVRCVMRSHQKTLLEAHSGAHMHRSCTNVRLLHTHFRSRRVRPVLKLAVGLGRALAMLVIWLHAVQLMHDA